MEILKTNVSVIILAAGSGTRMQSSVTKQQIKILGKTVLSHTLRAFEEAKTVSHITVVTRADEVDFAYRELESVKKPYKVIVGGNTRAESAKIGFMSLDDSAEFVAIHDCARCLITPQMIDSISFAAYSYGCASATMRVVDTVKQIDGSGFITATASRNYLRRAATPQIFKKSIYKKALEKAESISAEITDDNMLVELMGEKIAAVDTDNTNIKITEPADVFLAEKIISHRKEGSARTDMNIRIGHGYDVHKIVAGRKMIIGGVEIPYDKGLLGHSDADVLVHAIMDALLGAAALGDIGHHFPDTSEDFKDISSIKLLIRVNQLLKDEGYNISNIDATLVMQAPKVAQYIEKMRENIAFALAISKDLVNIKATTEEKLGFTGSGEGAAAHAVALIRAD